MIKADVTKNNKNIVKLKNSSVFLLNDVESNLCNKPINNIYRNGNVNKLSVNVRNGEVLFKQFLG